MSFATGNNSIDSLVYSSWNAAPGSPVTLTYSFLTRVPAGASDDDRSGFRAMSPTQQAAVRDALAQWASVANVTFAEVPSNTGNLQFGTNTQSDSGGYAYLPENGVQTLTMYLNNASATNTVFTAGSYAPTVLIHEIGHMLGLKHPGAYDTTGTLLGGPYLPAETDNGDYTQMSYNDPTSYAINRTFMTTPMLYDIQAMQYLYGANMSYHTGADAYRFANNTPPECIWDAGGTDTLDFSLCTGPTIINLNAGTFSETASGLHNVSIAYNVTIEGAIAGSGGSTIYANGAGNTLTGGAGMDTFYEGAGNDTISGGGGQDTVVFSGAYGSYVLARSGDTFTVVGDGTDIITGVETLRFADRVVDAASVGQSLGGTSGNDVIVAGTAAATIDGAAGIDTVVFGGTLAATTVARNGDAVVVTQNGVADTLVNVERLQFGDTSLALDLNGQAGQLYRLYEVVLDRAPDAGGLGYWLAQQGAGHSLLEIAHSFLQSEEFATRYGTNNSNEAFVTRLYELALHRQPDADGFAFHVACLEQGISREQVLLGFSESPEFIGNLAPALPVGVQFTPWLG
jgi:predicted Zn-dependent protease